MKAQRSEKRHPITASKAESRARRGATKGSPARRPHGSGDVQAGRRNRMWALWIGLALIAGNLLVFGPIRNHDFVAYDDPAYVTENPQVLAGLTWRGLAWACTSGYAANWHPLTWISHMLDVQFYGVNAGLHHLTSLVLHIAGALLLFAFLYRTTGAPARSAFVSGLFAIHPLHVESVAWIAERKDVLSTVFWMLTLCTYAWYVRKPGVVRYLIVAACFALGLLAKPMLVTLPFVLLLLDVWPLRRMMPGAAADTGSPNSSTSPAARTVPHWLWLEKIPMLMMAAASSLVTFMVQQQGGAVNGLDVYPLTLRLENALVSYVAYIGKMVWPARLAVMYPYPQAISAGWVAGAVLILLGVTLLVIREARRRPYLPVGWFWFLGTLVPVIGLVQVGIQAMADRYTYVPLVGLFIMVAWGVPELLHRWKYAHRALAVASIFVLVACAAAARNQVGYWKDNVALWTHTTEVTLNLENYRAHNALGMVLREQGRTEEAMKHFSEAVRIRPGFAEAQRNLGLTLANAGRTDEAITSLTAAARLEPESARAHGDLAFALSLQGRLDEAIAEYSEALRLDPSLARVHNALGAALAGAKKSGEALAHFSEAVRLDPDYAEAHNNLGLALAGEGRIDEAFHQFSEAARLKPGYAEAHNNLGLVLADQGKFSDAIAQYSEAVRLRPGFESAQVNLGMALANAGKIDDAIRQLTLVLQINPKNPAALSMLESLTGKK